MPCPYRDHNEQFMKWVKQYGLKPEDGSKETAFAKDQKDLADTKDPGRYNKKWHSTINNLQNYLTPYKIKNTWKREPQNLLDILEVLKIILTFDINRTIR